MILIAVIVYLALASALGTYLAGRQPPPTYEDGYWQRMKEVTPSNRKDTHMSNIVWIGVVLASLLCVGCGGDLNPSAPSLTSQSLGRCQTAGSTVGILDQTHGC